MKWHILLVIATVGTVANGERVPFVATNEWQEILPHHKVPSGLHYRMNLETGKTEAKMLDPEESSSPVAEVVASTGADVTASAAGKEEGIRQLSEEEVKRRREALEMVKMNKDIEIIQGLLDNFDNSSLDRKLVILEDLEFYLHQIDNARDFCIIGGLERIVIPGLLDRDNPRITAMSAMIVGSASQSNQPVKDVMMKLGILDLIVNNLKMTKTEGEDWMELMSRLVYALSSILRDYPRALERFTQLSGFQIVLDNVLKMGGSSEGRTRLKLKTLSFISNVWESEEQPAEITKGYCLVITDEDEFYEELFLGRVEVLAEIIDVFSKSCAQEFQKSVKVRNWLKRAEDFLAKEMEDEDDGDFKEYLSKIMSNVKTSQKFLVKDEL